MGIVRYANRWRVFLSGYDNWRLLLAEVNKMAYLRTYLRDHTEAAQRRSLHHAQQWLIHTIRRGEDRGSGTYYFDQGWTSSYPETTGYIVPTLLCYAARKDAQWGVEAQQAARQAGQWLLTVQREDGGWPGGYVHQQRPSVVFNTGQILRGMHALYLLDGPEKGAHWKVAAERAILWIWNQLDEHGQFSTNDFMGAVRVYGTYVVAPILAWLPEFPQYQKEWEAHAKRHLNWVLAQQNELGWFDLCDNTLHGNDRPIIHTLAYTLDGLWDCGVSLDDPTYRERAMVGARYLATDFLTRGMLNGRYDKNWRGSQAFIPTGGAQLAILWHKMYERTGEAIWKSARDQMNLLLSVLATRGARESQDSLGALGGSFPMWGRYETFGLPNWATKYFADSLMNELSEEV